MNVVSVSIKYFFQKHLQKRLNSNHNKIFLINVLIFNLLFNINLKDQIKIKL